MSTSQTPEAAPQAAQPQPEQAPASPAPQQAAPAPGAAGPPQAQRDPRKLSVFLKISIVLLAALSIASIALLFLGSFEGNFVRIFSTFVIFTVFVLLTALDTNLDRRSTWYAPVALIGNSYILAIVLIVTWMSPYEPFFLGWAIFWKGLFVIAVTRVVILCCQLLIGVGDRYPSALGAFAFITSILAVISGILFTAPVAIEVFNVRIPELYWRFAVAGLLLTALALAITLLLRWSYGAPDREAARQAREAAREHYRQVAYASTISTQMVAMPVAQPGPQPVAPAQAVPMPAQPVPMPASAPPRPEPVAEGDRLPWPTFADGRPLPIGPDGQPDFGVPGAPPRP